jgi:D-alanyl-lipoteichoic acid acyltransferase DltB (MBOAT superfamily)
LGFNLNVLHYDILLPAGISFFTFQSMTYTIETYRRNIKPCHSPRDFLLFVAFFPQLLAGPINRAVDLLPQFVQRVRASATDFEMGLAQFA